MIQFLIPISLPFVAGSTIRARDLVDHTMFAIGLNILWDSKISRQLYILTSTPVVGSVFRFNNQNCIGSTRIDFRVGKLGASFRFSEIYSVI